MSADIAHTLRSTTQPHEHADGAAAQAVRRRARIVLALGPLAVTAGIVWALAQPWRLTLLHPYGQGFWWLVAEPPLYVVLVGLLFRRLVAPGIVADLLAAAEEEAGETE